MAVIRANAVPHLIRLLASPSDVVEEQAAWALANIAGDSTETRDVVLQQGGLTAILQNIGRITTPRLNAMRTHSWAISNMCRGKPEPSSEGVSAAIPIISRLMFSETDQEVLTNLCWSLSYISGGSNTQIQEVIDVDGIIPKLLEFLKSNSTIQSPALRTLGNIATGDDSQTQAVLDHDILSVLLTLLDDAKKNIRTESCWIISNIAAGTTSQVQAILNTPGLLPKLIYNLNNPDSSIKKETLWAIGNMISGGCIEQVITVLDSGPLPSFCDACQMSDFKFNGPNFLLESLERLFPKLKEYNLEYYGKIMCEIKGCDAFKFINSLQSHSNSTVSSRAIALFENYFNVEEENVSGAVAATLEIGSVFVEGEVHEKK